MEQGPAWEPGTQARAASAGSCTDGHSRERETVKPQNTAARAPGTWAKSAYPLFGVLRAIGALLMRGGIIPSERLKRATEGHRSRHKGHTPEGDRGKRSQAEGVA